MKVIISLLLYLFSLPAFAGSIQMSSEYLSGEWCYTHYEAGGEKEQENITYIFSSDGTLLYQNSSLSKEVGSKGSYTIVGDELKIRPVFAAFTLRIKSIEASTFVLTGFGDHYFVKGRCK